MTFFQPESFNNLDVYKDGKNVFVKCLRLYYCFIFMQPNARNIVSNIVKIFLKDDFIFVCFENLLVSSLLLQAASHMQNATLCLKKEETCRFALPCGHIFEQHGHETEAATCLW